MKAGEPVTVVKRGADGRELWRYQGTVLAASDQLVILEAVYDQPDENFHGLELRRGDRFVESHYGDRWYNVFAIHDVDTGECKGWYCNVSRPASFDGDVIAADDLALDLVVNTEGQSIVLDQEEFNALELSETDRAAAIAALRELQQLAAKFEGPFRPEIVG